MSSSKVIILTGASRGIGLAIAHYLLKQSHKLLVVARSAGPLEALEKEYPGQVKALAADLSDSSVGEKAVSLAIETFSRIDGLLINHGTLGAVKKVADSTPEEWRSCFDINFFSAIGFIKSALPALRKTNGKIVLCSSGAASGAYATWGPYGASKAAMNHLAMTLGEEEPTITTVSIRPGVVDTEMQREIREVHAAEDRGEGKGMTPEDAAKFHGLHKSGKLLKPEQPGHVMAKLVIDAPADLSGKFLSWDSSELSSFQ